MSVAQRRFATEISALLDKSVLVMTVDKKNYTGSLIGVNPETLSLCLSDVKDESGKNLDRLVLNGNVVTQILAIEKPFDLRALADRLEKVFPTMIRLYEDKGFIWVMDKIKVTEKGIVEGTGPAAERVQRVYDQFLSGMTKSVVSK